MTPNELYKRVPESVSHDPHLLHGFYYNLVPEVDLDQISWDISCPKLLIKILKDFDFDGRRGWRLATVWFSGKPVMIIRNAGRELDDHADRFITDVSTYRELISYLHSYTTADSQEITDVVNPNDDIPNLTSFYGYELDGYFKRF